jgi:hypothetical protein
VASRLVLTSAHVVAEDGASVSVFHPSWAGVFTGTVVWRGTFGCPDDAALVAIEDPAWNPVDIGAVVWGRSVTHRPGIACECWGVPNLVQRTGRPIDVVQLSGTLNPGDRLVCGEYVMQLATFPPEGASPWGGMSGAALLSEDLLIGVIATEPAQRAHAVLEALPVSRLLRDPGFAAIVSAHSGVSELGCDAIELRPLADAQTRVPTGWSVPSPAGLLPARRAVVPFHGRDGDLLADLNTWATAPGVDLVAARPGRPGQDPPGPPVR